MSSIVTEGFLRCRKGWYRGFRRARACCSATRRDQLKRTLSVPCTVSPAHQVERAAVLFLLQDPVVELPLLVAILAGRAALKVPREAARMVVHQLARDRVFCDLVVRAHGVAEEELPQLGNRDGRAHVHGFAY